VPTALPRPVRVLVVDDERAVRAALERALRLERFDVATAFDGQDALDTLSVDRFDAIILDVMMPRLDGLELCRRLRDAGDRTPVLMLTARDAVDDLVEGLDAGADDYIGKPFSLAELISRVRAILRRRLLDRGPLRARLRVGDVEIDLVRHLVAVAGQLVRLTPTEFRMLVLLAQAPGQTFSAQAILRHLWQTDYVGEASACKAHVFNLRRKIEDDHTSPVRLVTVPGVGYALLPWEA